MHRLAVATHKIRTFDGSRQKEKEREKKPVLLAKNFGLQTIVSTSSAPATAAATAERAIAREQQ